MQRYTISIEDSLAERFDEWIRRNRYENRSEAIRDLLRDRFSQDAMATEMAESECVACVSYVYDHHQRELGRRLAQGQHEHHDLAVSTLHVHLDAHQCLEVALLRGNAARVRDQAQRLTAERGVRYGQVHLVPVMPDHDNHHDHDHSHGDHHHGETHEHEPARAPFRARPSRGK